MFCVFVCLCAFGVIVRPCVCLCVCLSVGLGVCLFACVCGYLCKIVCLRGLMGVCVIV